jgi:DNA-binding response OmpR family regulator
MSPPDPASTAPVVLVVEDDAMARDLVEQILDDAGYRVLAAESGARAIEIVRNGPPDLVVLDIMMPGMEGREVCRWLRSNPSTEAVPVIFLSAIDSLAEKLKAFEAGGNDFVSKPFDDRQFLKKVKDLLRLSGARTSMERIRRR